MALLSDYKTKLRMAFYRQLPVEARAFFPSTSTTTERKNKRKNLDIKSSILIRY